MRSQAGLILIVLVSIAACGGTGESAAPSPSSSTPDASSAPAQTTEPTVSTTLAPVATPAPSTTTYVVARGDTLTAIAKRFGISLAALRAANPDVKNPRLLQIGHELVIPSR